MNCIAIDPGTRESAIVQWNGGEPSGALILPNQQMAYWLAAEGHRDTPLVIEWIESQGMAVGKETFETVYWVGVFAALYGLNKTHRMGRRAVKLFHCNTVRATDANIRQAVMDRFGGESAFGKKKSPGPLFGITSHKMAALALAIAWSETEGKSLRVDQNLEGEKDESGW